MKKWYVEFETVIQAKTREDAWQIGETLCKAKLRGLAQVHRVGLEPLKDEEWIAENESIKAAR